MSDHPHLATVANIVADHLVIDQSTITPASDLYEDLGADSLDTVELVMAFEEEFEILITDDDSEKAQTIGDFLKLIDRLTAN